jgi:hypothetical protein
MIARLALRRLKALLRQYPAVALLGARQSGKTTLATSLGGAYYDLEQDNEQLRLDLQWDETVEAGALVVLDEAQAHPEVFPRLRGVIDAARRKKGRFLILGSVSPTLMRQVSESLAGRLGLCELTPFLLPEVKPRLFDRLWLRGGYPDGGILQQAQFPDWQGHYLRLLAERDLPLWGLPAKPQVTQRLLKMLAASHGTILNSSELGRSLGLSYHTVSSYLDYLEGAFLIRRLSPFHGNIRKRLTKNPKIYWRDSGIVHALLGVSTMEELLSRPWVGASFEGFVTEQILGYLSAMGIEADPCFFRTSDGHEIDLVLELRGERWAVEVKLSAAPGPDDLERLNQCADLIQADRRVLVSRTRTTAGAAKVVSTNLAGLVRLLRAER